jgi:uncharacterized protein YecT (DUF1311 family)
MKQILAAIAFGSLALGVNAADSARDPCAGSGAEDAARCQAKSWESAEKEMQQSYEKALVNIQRLKDSQLTAKFKEAQEAWVKSRALQCWVAAYYESPAWSTVWEGNCKATEAKNRAAYLRDTFK